jgi:hypothetical protein
LRFAILISIFLEFEDPFSQGAQAVTLFVDPWLVTLFIGITALPLSRICGVDLAIFGAAESRTSNLRWRAASYALLATGVFLLCGAFLFQDPGKPKNGRILMDDRHSKRWEQSTLQMGNTILAVRSSTAIPASSIG